MICANFKRKRWNESNEKETSSRIKKVLVAEVGNLRKINCSLDTRFSVQKLFFDSVEQRGRSQLKRQVKIVSKHGKDCLSMELFSRRRWMLVLGQVVSCYNYEMPKQLRKFTKDSGQICWTIGPMLTLHFILLKSSVDSSSRGREQRTLTYFVRGSITVWLTSCWNGLDLAKQVNLFLIKRKSNSWIQTN